MIAVLLFTSAIVVAAPDNSTESTCNTMAKLRFTYAWPLSDDCDNLPRGGSSKGADVVLASKASNRWLALQESGLSRFERDRRAILAMSGGYKVNFDFLETVGFSKNYKRDNPYQSWGTEFVYVVADKPKFISLQHIMVMYFKQPDGSVSAPMVMKHWRQDWTYEDTRVLEYHHRTEWRSKSISKHESKGQWTQAVFQVDDSPRYESIGEWQHNASFSTWKSEVTRRPLPRREFSVREDYNVLEGFNSHTITRTGWVQEEENWKLVVDEEGLPITSAPYLSKEQGLARYQVITDFNFKPGDEFMALAGQFWADVRAEWKNVIVENETLNLRKIVDEQPLFVPLFSYAEKIMSAGEYDNKEGKKYVHMQISRYVD